ncbi:hypothetical protein CDL15_Pgr008321 [Punica granatum]|uniref:Uncharacterized protein n=1 Tax=Punica granatum TaxID=22663 RepID=A0A218XRR0_PUNGR|nr:hypothetical protein CDL15_Pgr008321 [Punica granatum]
MTRSVPTSLAGVTHDGDLGANFNQGGPSVRRLPRLCWCELQPGMPQCTSLAEVVLVRTSTEDAPVYVAWKCLSWVGYLRAEPLPCQSIREKAREEFSERREPVHHSSPVTGVSLQKMTKKMVC